MFLSHFFSPDIWGTVSDWVMICVTFITAILLLMTLKSQKDVQKTQNELFRIENIRFKESIKPILKYSVSKNQMNSGDNKKKLLTIEVINETNSNALNISRFVCENEHSKQLFIIMGFGDKRDHLVKGDFPLLFHFEIDSEVSSQFIDFIMKYQDIAETKYQQRVLCIYDKDYGVEIHPGLPEVIS